MDERRTTRDTIPSYTPPDRCLEITQRFRPDMARYLRLRSTSARGRTSWIIPVLACCMKGMGNERPERQTKRPRRAHRGTKERPQSQRWKRKRRSNSVYWLRRCDVPVPFVSRMSRLLLSWDFVQCRYESPPFVQSFRLVAMPGIFLSSSPDCSMFERHRLGVSLVRPQPHRFSILNVHLFHHEPSSTNIIQHPVTDQC
jgi:hypothetical protein